MSSRPDSWTEAATALHERIVAVGAFREVVRNLGNPASDVPSRRSARVATVVCELLELDPAIYRGNVYGAAARAVEQRTLTPTYSSRR